MLECAKLSVWTSENIQHEMKRDADYDDKEKKNKMKRDEDHDDNIDDFSLSHSGAETVESVRL